MNNGIGAAGRFTFRLMKHVLFIALFGAMLASLTGCLYPDNMRKENQIAPRDDLFVVQHAVDEFHNATGVLPIANSTMETPIFEKYKIDFKKLLENRYLGTIPANAFEQGGTNIYVLVNPELQPEVKLMDLVTYQEVGDIQKAVDAYRTAHDGQLPAGQPAAPGFYLLDFDKMGKKQGQIRSVYSPGYLSLLLHRSGEVVIDYAPEIMKILNKKGIASPPPDTDLRTYLAANSFFVPVKSYPYYWKNNAPVAAER